MARAQPVSTEWSAPGCGCNELTDVQFGFSERKCRSWLKIK